MKLIRSSGPNGYFLFSFFVCPAVESRRKKSATKFIHSFSPVIFFVCRREQKKVKVDEHRLISNDRKWPFWMTITFQTTHHHHYTTNIVVKFTHTHTQAHLKNGRLGEKDTGYKVELWRVIDWIEKFFFCWKILFISKQVFFSFFHICIWGVFLFFLSFDDLNLNLFFKRKFLFLHTWIYDVLETITNKKFCWKKSIWRSNSKRKFKFHFFFTCIDTWIIQ